MTRKIAVVLLAAILAGCTSAPNPVRSEAPPPVLGSEPPSGGAENGGAAPIDTQQYIKVTKKWSSNGPNYDWTGLYTSVVITDTNETNSQSDAIRRNYDDEKRDMLSRFFSSWTRSITAGVQIDVHNPATSTLVPLYSLTHASSSDVGENFSTTFTISNLDVPLFRIDAKSTLTVTPRFKYSDDYTFQIPPQVVSAVTTALAAVAPGSAILTTVSKPEFDNAAKAVQSTLGTLMQVSIDESVPSALPLSAWTQSSEVVVDGYAPWRIKTGDSSQDGTGYVGRWIVTISCPSVSVFYAPTVCDGAANRTISDYSTVSALVAGQQRTVAAEVTIGAILSKPIATQITVADFIKKQSWYTDYLAATPDRKPYSTFCASLVNSFTAAGLNDFDAALILRAAITGMPVVKDKAAAFKSNCAGDLRTNNFDVTDLAVSRRLPARHPLPPRG